MLSFIHKIIGSTKDRMVQAERLNISDSITYKASEYTIISKKSVGNNIYLTLKNRQGKIHISLNKKELVKTN